MLNHPDYKKDSVVSSEIAYDLVASVLELSADEEKKAKFYGLKKWDLDIYSLS